MNDQSKVRSGIPISRRDLLKAGGFAGAASVLAACGVTSTPQVPSSSPTLECPTPGTAQSSGPSKPEIAMRIAQISDMHVGPEGPAVQGFTQALRSIQARQPGIDFIINAGDCVGDALGGTDNWVQAEWDAFTGVLKAECKLPIHHAIGNHDVRGWGNPPNQQKTTPPDLFGKGWAVKELGLSNRYYTFDNAGWRFLILDSAQRPDPAFGDTGQVYIGQIDEEQFNWLEQQLGSTSSSMPVCVVSHIPILSACELLDGNTEQKGNWLVPGAWVHIDARRLWRLFWQHRNLKLCLSGHTHQFEDLRYHGVNYITDGAICGNFWNSAEPAYFDFPPGYTVVNLYKDGSWDNEFVTY